MTLCTLFLFLQLLDIDIVLNSPRVIVPGNGRMTRYRHVHDNVIGCTCLIYIRVVHDYCLYQAYNCFLFSYCSSSSVLLADLGSLRVTSDMQFNIPDVRVRIMLTRNTYTTWEMFYSVLSLFLSLSPFLFSLSLPSSPSLPRMLHWLISKKLSTITSTSVSLLFS